MPIYFPLSTIKKNNKIIYKYLKPNKGKEALSLEFRQKEKDKAKSYLLGKIEHNDLMNKKHNNVCRAWIFSSISLLSLMLPVTVFQILNLSH